MSTAAAPVSDDCRPTSAASPVVSVVMPVYNASRYIGQAVQSILDQSFREFELIVVDDGSDDGTAEVVRRLAAADPRVRVLSQSNSGVSAAANAGIREATGEFVARMDADDVALPDRLALQVAYMQTNPHVVCLGGAFEVMDARGRVLTCLYPPLTHSRIDSLLMRGHCAITQPTALMRREALERVGGYDSSYVQAEDLDLWLRLGETGTLANLSVPVIRYRLLATSLSGANRAQQREAAMQACVSAWRRRGVAGRFDASENWRPGPDRASRHRFACRYGWWAFNYGQRAAAVVYGLKAVALRPWSSGGWTLLACSLLKRLPANRTPADRGEPLFSERGS